MDYNSELIATIAREAFEQARQAIDEAERKFIAKIQEVEDDMLDSEEDH